MKINIKRNTTTGNSVKTVMDIAIRSWIATILFLSHTGLGWIARPGPGSLKKICVKQSKDLGSVIQVWDRWIIRNQYLQVSDR